MAATERQRVCVGVISGVHGVRGVVRVKPFTESPDEIDAYGPLEDESGSRRFSLEVIGTGKGVVLCAIDGVEDRTAAEKLRGTKLYVARAALPALDEEDAFYHSDLLGLAVVFADGTRVGSVAAVYDFGAGDVVEIAGDAGGTAMIPFTREAVPTVDLEGGRLVVEKLPGLLEGPVEPSRTARKKRGQRGGPEEAEVGQKARAEARNAEDWPDEDWR